MSDERHLTPDDLAKRLGLHRATVLRMFHDGILPGVTLCRGKKRTTVRFRLSSIETFERKRERERPAREEEGASDRPAPALP